VRPDDGHYRASISAQHLYRVPRLPTDESDSPLNRKNEMSNYETERNPLSIQ
jgi:hypothetical protein